MTASTKRRRRYEPAPKPAHNLTPLKAKVLETLALSRFLTTRHVQAIHGFSEKAARGHLRDLFDMRLVGKMPVQGVSLGKKALLDSDLHFPTKEGYKALKMQSGDGAPLVLPQYLLHEYAIRDALAWLATSARSHDGHDVEQWDCSGIPLCGAKMDALFVYRFSESEVAVGFLEADMGTERATGGSRSDRWGAKITAYSEAFADPYRVEVKKATGGRSKARLVVTVPTRSRAQWVAERLQGTEAGAFAWIAVQEELEGADVYSPLWLRPDGNIYSFLEKEG